MGYWQRHPASCMPVACRKQQVVICHVCSGLGQLANPSCLVHLLPMSGAISANIRLGPAAASRQVLTCARIPTLVPNAAPPRALVTLTPAKQPIIPPTRRPLCKCNRGALSRCPPLQSMIIKAGAGVCGLWLAPVFRARQPRWCTKCRSSPYLAMLLMPGCCSWTAQLQTNSTATIAGSEAHSRKIVCPVLRFVVVQPVCTVFDPFLINSSAPKSEHLKYACS